jgi:hypothetical protein
MLDPQINRPAHWLREFEGRRTEGRTRSGALPGGTSAALGRSMKIQWR